MQDLEDTENERVRSAQKTMGLLMGFLREEAVRTEKVRQEGYTPRAFVRMSKERGCGRGHL